MIILDGKKTSNEIKAEIAESVKEIIAKGLRPPHLAAVIVGDDGASLTYVGSKVRACKRVGFNSTLIKLPESISENELLEKVDELKNIHFTSTQVEDSHGHSSSDSNTPEFQLDKLLTPEEEYESIKELIKQQGES